MVVHNFAQISLLGGNISLRNWPVPEYRKHSWKKVRSHGKTDRLDRYELVFTCLKIITQGYLFIYYLILIEDFLFAAIGRTLIPRYFRSIFEGGVTELYYNMKHPKESFHNTSITLDCDQCTMVTHHGKPLLTKVRIT